MRASESEGKRRLTQASKRKRNYLKKREINVSRGENQRRRGEISQVFKRYAGNIFFLFFLTDSKDNFRNMKKMRGNFINKERFEE